MPAPDKTKEGKIPIKKIKQTNRKCDTPLNVALFYFKHTHNVYVKTTNFNRLSSFGFCCLMQKKTFLYFQFFS